MNSRYLKQISFSEAELAEQAALEVVRATEVAQILGFECEPTVTLGIRAGDQDLVVSPDLLAQMGFVIARVDRGGQATLHHPGQLVVFPVAPIQNFGARGWVCHLARTTVRCLSRFGIRSEWNEKRPGIYTQNGKISAIGVRIRDGISTHGISINVSNDLASYQLIRSCGVTAALVDKIGNYLAEVPPLEEVFQVWLEEYSQNHPNCELLRVR